MRTYQVHLPRWPPAARVGCALRLAERVPLGIVLFFVPRCVCWWRATSPPPKQVHKAPLGDEVCVAYLGTLQAATWSLLPSAAAGPLPSAAPAGVTLTYGGGQGGRSAAIHLLCDPQSTGLTSPSFNGTDASTGVSTFFWKNIAGCPVKAHL
jgi:hypothetical protein